MQKRGWVGMRAYHDQALIDECPFMTVKQSPSPILSDTIYKVTNSSSSADTLFIISTPFLQPALCKDGVQF